MTHPRRDEILRAAQMELIRGATVRRRTRRTVGAASALILTAALGVAIARMTPAPRTPSETTAPRQTAPTVTAAAPGAASGFEIDTSLKPASICAHSIDNATRPSAQFAESLDDASLLRALEDVGRPSGLARVGDRLVIIAQSSPPQT